MGGVAAGTRIGPYEINSLVGAGGMGEVYRAFDPRLGREVALKILPAAEAENPSWLARFEREARAVASLSHHNIIAVHDVGADRGTSYIVTELLDGETLRERIAAGPVPLATALDWAQQIARGLAAAHAGGIVHRDLKPANLFVTREGLVKLLDFGIAKVMDGGGLKAEHEPRATPGGTVVDDLTAPGAALGTAGYMSPEQVRGDPADARSDIFAFGGVAYELVTGRRAFRGNTASDVGMAILTETPPPMMTASGPAPPELERLVRRCLEKRADDRFQSADEVCTALGSLASGADGRRRRGRRLFVVLAPLAVLLLAALAGTAYFRARVERGPIGSIAVLPFASATTDTATDLANGITDTVINSLSQLPELRVMASNTVFQYDGKADARKVGRDLGVRAVLLGRVARRGDDLTIQVELVNVDDGSQLWGERYDKKLAEVLDVQQDIAREIAERLRLQLTVAESALLSKRPTHSVGAYELVLMASHLWSENTLYLASLQYRSSAEDIKRLRDYYQQAIELDPSYAAPYAGLSGLYGFTAARGLVAPNETWPKAQAAVAKAMDLDPTFASFYYHQLASFELYYRRDWPTAERAFKRAIQLNPNDEEVREHYALCLALVGRTDEGWKEIDRVHKVDRLSPNYGDSSGVSALMMLYWSRRLDELIAQGRKRVDYHPGEAFTHELLGNAYEQKALYEDAIAEWRKAMMLSDDKELAAILDRANAESGYPGVMRSIWQTRLDRLSRTMARGEYVAAAQLARVHARLGDTEGAIASLEQAYDERNSLMLEAGLDPVFDGIRSDPRFVALVGRLLLTP